MAKGKNYTTSDGSTTVIGGTMIIRGSLRFEESADLPQGTKARYQEDSHAKTIAALRHDFNDLLGKLQEAGFMEEEDE